MHLKLHQKGFTLTELLVVLFVMGVIAALSVVSFKDFNERQTLRVASQDVYTALIDARGDTLASENDSVYGVHIDANQIVRFVGASYDPNSASNATSTLLAPVAATSSLTGGSADIVFARLTGKASATGTIMLHTNGEATTTITINASGLIEKEL